MSKSPWLYLFNMLGWDCTNTLTLGVCNDDTLMDSVCVLAMMEIMHVLVPNLGVYVQTYIKTRGSESRGQEEAGCTSTMKPTQPLL